MSNKNYDVNFSNPRDFVDPWAKIQDSTNDISNIFGDIDTRIKDENKSILDRNDRLAREKEARDYQARRNKILDDRYRQEQKRLAANDLFNRGISNANLALRQKRDAIQNANANFDLKNKQDKLDRANATEAVSPFLIGLQSIYGDQAEKIKQNKNNRDSEVFNTLSFLNDKLNSSKPSVSSTDDLSDKDKILYKSGLLQLEKDSKDYRLNVAKLHMNIAELENKKQEGHDFFGVKDINKINTEINNKKQEILNLKKPMTKEEYSAQFFKGRVGKQTPSQIEDSKTYSDALKSYKDWAKSKEGKSYLAGGTLHDPKAEEANNWINSNYERIVKEKNITDPLQLKALRTGLVNEYNRQLGVSQKIKIEAKKRMQDREDKTFDLSNKIAELKVKFENNKELQNIKDKTKLKTTILELMKGDPNYKDIIENAKLMNKVYKAFDVLN